MQLGPRVTAWDGIPRHEADKPVPSRAKAISARMQNDGLAPVGTARQWRAASVPGVSTGLGRVEPAGSVGFGARHYDATPALNPERPPAVGRISGGRNGLALTGGTHPDNEKTAGSP